MNHFVCVIHTVCFLIYILWENKVIKNLKGKPKSGNKNLHKVYLVLQGILNKKKK